MWELVAEQGEVGRFRPVEASGGLRLGRPIALRHVWTHWQNHMFTSSPTLGPSSSSQSATSREDAAVCERCRSGQVHFDQSTWEQPWSLHTANIWQSECTNRDIPSVTKRPPSGVVKISRLIRRKSCATFPSSDRRPVEGQYSWDSVHGAVTRVF